MPIYEYQCTACQHAFDALQKIADAPLTDCPECQQPELKKLVSAPNFRLKGGGWYETDFKDRNKRNLAGDSGNADSGQSGSTDSGEQSAGKSESTKAEGGKREAKQPAADQPAGKATQTKASGSQSSGAQD